MAHVFDVLNGTSYDDEHASARPRTIASTDRPFEDRRPLIIEAPALSSSSESSFLR
jgi:hypothetical protein